MKIAETIYILFQKGSFKPVLAVSVLEFLEFLFHSKIAEIS
jgi:hypothetical protein